jgi:two-component sensor histidine kinase
MTDELNHRVKNTLATVQSIAAQSLKGTMDGQGWEAFDSRLVALSRTHDLLARDSWEGASLRELLLQEPEPYRTGEGTRFVVDGPDFGLPPKAALALGMAFHELTTNSAKYGALTKPAGQVRVPWELLRSSEARTLRLQWTETGGPAVENFKHKGFGSILLERGLSLELDGEVRIDPDPSGIVCTMQIPLPAYGSR